MTVVVKDPNYDAACQSILSLGTYAKDGAVKKVTIVFTDKLHHATPDLLAKISVESAVDDMMLSPDEPKVVYTSSELIVHCYRLEVKKGRIMPFTILYNNVEHECILPNGKMLGCPSPINSHESVLMDIL